LVTAANRAAFRCRSTMKYAAMATMIKTSGTKADKTGNNVASSDLGTML
jgi:hypothetical protein